jgi:hypothetical protein
MPSPSRYVERVHGSRPDAANRPFAHRDAIDCRPPASWRDGAAILLLMLGGLMGLAMVGVWLTATA